MENNLNYQLKKRIKKDNWYLSRSYLHFDLPISFKKASKIVKNSSIVEKHSFLPFITFDIKSSKYQLNIETKRKEKVEKIRNISYSSHIDGHIYSYYSLVLSKCYESKLIEKSLSDNILAFRKLGKSNIDFAKQAFDDIENNEESSIIALDFSKFFDTLDHEILKEQWCQVLNVKVLPKDHYKVFKSITKFSRVNRDDVYKYFTISKNNPKTNNRKKICSIKEFRDNVRGKKLIITNLDNKGIPQGSPISALLSNIYMIDFDEIIKNYVDTFNGKYYRYCDDILIIAPLNRKDEVEKFVSDESKKLKISLNPDKTEKSEFKYIKGKLKLDKPIQYLGFVFNGEEIFIRPSSIARYYQKMKKSVSIAKKSRDKINIIRVKNSEKSKKLYKRKLYEKYSHLGKSNFVTYGLRAKNKMNDSFTIKRQIRKLWKNLEKEIKL